MNNNVSIPFTIHKTDPSTCIACDLLYCIRTSSIYTCINRRKDIYSVLHFENGTIMSSGHYDENFLPFCELGLVFLMKHYPKPLFLDVK